MVAKGAIALCMKVLRDLCDIHKISLWHVIG